MKRNVFLLLSLLVAFFLMLGCAGGEPSNSRKEQAIRDSFRGGRRVPNNWRMVNNKIITGVEKINKLEFTRIKSSGSMKKNNGGTLPANLGMAYKDCWQTEAQMKVNLTLIEQKYIGFREGYKKFPLNREFTDNREFMLCEKLNGQLEIPRMDGI